MLTIIGKKRQPIFLDFNKVNIGKENKVIEWMRDYQSLQQALSKKVDYISTFSSSLSLLLNEFYKAIKYASVISKAGEVFDSKKMRRNSKKIWRRSLGNTIIKNNCLKILN